MTAKVPTIDSGTARLGISVADTLRRNTKITSTTRAMVSSRVNCTSCTDSRMATERSYTTLRPTAAGSCARNTGSRASTASTTSMVFVPGWRWMASTTARSLLNHEATLSVCTPSMTRPTSSSRTGEPLR